MKVRNLISKKGLKWEMGENAKAKEPISLKVKRNICSVLKCRDCLSFHTTLVVEMQAGLSLLIRDAGN